MDYNKYDISKINFADYLIYYVFNNYNQEYILNHLNNIADFINYKNIYSYNYYDSWRIFTINNLINKINQSIYNDLYQSKKKLAVMLQFVNSKDLIYEPSIFKDILNMNI